MQSLTLRNRPLGKLLLPPPWVRLWIHPVQHGGFADQQRSGGGCPPLRWVFPSPDLEPPHVKQGFPHPPAFPLQLCPLNLLTHCLLFQQQ